MCLEIIKHALVAAVDGRLLYLLYPVDMIMPMKMKERLLLVKVSGDAQHSAVMTTVTVQMERTVVG